jgi:hypothetical protein
VVPKNGVREVAGRIVFQEHKGYLSQKCWPGDSSASEEHLHDRYTSFLPHAGQQEHLPSKTPNGEIHIAITEGTLLMRDWAMACVLL